MQLILKSTSNNLWDCVIGEEDLTSQKYYEKYMQSDINALHIAFFSHPGTLFSQSDMPHSLSSFRSLYLNQQGLPCSLCVNNIDPPLAIPTHLYPAFYPPPSLYYHHTYHIFTCGFVYCLFICNHWKVKSIRVCVDSCCISSAWYSARHVANACIYVLKD